MTTTQQIIDQRHATYDSPRALPIASGHSTGWWEQHLRHLPHDEDGLADRVILYIERATDSRFPGSLRSARKNVDATTANDYPWVMTDRPSILIQGRVVNDLVAEGDRVWSPGRGIFTVDERQIEDGRIVGVMSSGTEDATTWFRTTGHMLTPPEVPAEAPAEAPGPQPAVMASDLVVVETAVHPSVEGAVMQVREVRDDYIVVGGVGSSASYVATRWLLVKRDGVLQEGALVRPTRFQFGATDGYQDWARGQVFIATGRAWGGYIEARSSAAFDSTLQAGHTTRFPDVDIIGHKESRHAPVIGEQVKDDDSAPTGETDNSMNLLRAERDKARQDLVDLWAALEREARERGWCSEYDDFAHENGGPARTTNYRVEVEMQAAINEHRLDVALRPYLSSTNLVPDVQESVTVTNQAHVTFEATRQEMEDEETKSTKVEQALESEGWKFDSFGITDWHEA